MPLSRTAVRALRAEAHRINLKPVVMIGQHGLTEAVQSEIINAINHHELIKIRIPALEKPMKIQLIETICEDTQAELIQSIGHIIVIFKQKADASQFGKLARQ